MHDQASSTALGDDGRFTLEDLLGEGTSGKVYRAFDRTSGTRLAIKVLSQVDPAALFRFKSEFRTLAGLSHPNLLQLHELVRSGDQWLLTMQLVEGRDFLHFVRPELTSADSGADDGGADYEFPDTDDLGLVQREAANHNLAEPASAPSGAPLTSACDPTKLRACLQQLCEGLHALHQSGRIHRDLKPANVLVFDRTGRVVICDFGLALEIGAESRSVRGSAGSEASALTHASGPIAGTVVYMSPEQSMGLPLTAASDWYAVGVMLYQCLTGQTPFEAGASLRSALAAKLLQTPTHPELFVKDVPQDLADLSLALMNPLPGVRPGYREIVQMLAGATPPTASSSRPSVRAQPLERLIGREAELRALQRALGRVRGSGGASLVFVAGHSGVGKSALVDAFLGEAVRESCLILSGRCYEREQLPYKAFDPLMDALSTYLLELDDEAVRALLPPGTKALRQIFSALERVPPVRDFGLDESSSSDAFATRRDAFSALRELLRRLGQQRTLVLYIDDLQWGDLDSAPLFLELLRAPAPPAILLLCAYRSEEQERSALVSLLRGTYLRDAGIALESIAVENLSEADSKLLALSLLEGVDEADAIATLAAKEAHGSPFFISELTAYVRAIGSQSSLALTLDQVIGARLRALSPEARRILSLVAVSGRPETLELIGATARLADSWMLALNQLESQHLVRTTGASPSDRVEVYHDQIRERAYQELSESDRRAAHRDLAEAIERRAPEPEALFRHWRAAGEPVRALEQAIAAAHAAELSLAYDRAAVLYGEALALLEPHDRRTRGLREQMANALMSAGQGIAAARMFFQAIEGADAGHAAQLRGLAITQLLRAGELESAFDQLANAKALLGISLPTGEGQAFRMLLWRRLLLSLGGKNFRVRSETSLDPVIATRLQMLWALSAALSCVDLLRGSVYQAELVRLALKAGAPYHLACALSLSTVSLAAEARDPGRLDWLYDRALEMAGLSGVPHALSAVKGTVGVSRMLQGHFAEAVRLTRESQAVLRDRLNATLAWDRVTVVFFDLQASAMLGQVDTIIERVPDAVRDAEARGDLLASTLFRSFRCSWAYLGIDDAKQARAQALRAEKQWHQAGYSLQHYYVTHALSETALYSGSEIESAWERLQREWKAGFFVRNIQHARVELTWLRARLALALATSRPELLAQARRDAKSLRREKAGWAGALGRLVEAAVLARTGDPARARQLLVEASGLCDALDMRLLAQVARSVELQLRASSADEPTPALVQAEWRSFGMKRPERFIVMLAPGFDPFWTEPGRP